MQPIDWNHERRRTRDRLLDYDSTIVPAYPQTAGLSMIYPWVNIALSQLSYQIYLIAKNNGYDGDESDFWARFSNGNIHSYSTIDDFPIPGNTTDLYLETETGILYYFIATGDDVDADNIALVGGAIVGYSAVYDVTYIYLPVRALLIEDTILNCGDSEEDE